MYVFAMIMISTEHTEHVAKMGICWLWRQSKHYHQKKSLRIERPPHLASFYWNKKFLLLSKMPPLLLCELYRIYLNYKYPNS